MPPRGSARYETRLERFRESRRRVRERSGRTSRRRLLAFVATVALLLAAERTDPPWSVAVVAAAVVAFAAFLFLVRRHAGLRREERRLDVMVALNEEALARLERRWDDLPPPTAAAGLRDHPYAQDLDVVGPTSLERLLSTVSSGPGARTLRRWLLDGAPMEELVGRQEAVEELAARTDLRQELAARVRLAGLGREDPTASFLAWSDEGSWFVGRGWLLWTARLAPLATFLLLVLQLGGTVRGPWWLAGPLVGVLFLGGWTDRTGEVLDRISAGQRFLGAYGAPLEVVEEMEADSDHLRRVRDDARAGSGSASDALGRLERWITVADVRHNHLIHVPLQILLFWDVHVLRRLEAWRSENGAHVGRWLGALGETEALCALSSLRSDHSVWSFPDFDAGAGGIRATGLTHPLLPPGRAVPNDVEVGPSKTFLLVTGSNMSGKSTLLRAVGLAGVLARAGAPVSARSCVLAPLRVVTSMRTEDSLSRGVSSFMAELRRVALVVDLARAEGAGVLYLLDEPLQGTNEAERRAAVRIVVEKLLSTGAVGAVSTHDLLLHETERLRPAARPVHFTGAVEPGPDGLRPTFDYRLRPGPATSTNALDLLRIVGLGPEDPPRSES